jgi:chemotaxis protein CheD
VPPEPEREIFLNPGDFAFGDEGTRIRTILGSCVAVTFWHPGLRLGAMCHYLLPARGPSQNEPHGGKYAEEVIPIIAAHFAGKGLQPSAIQVKMFGGSNMFPGLSLGESLNIGTKNIHTGLAVLTRCGFGILNYDLAGGTNRTVVFDIGSGEVWVRQGQGPPLAPAPDRRRSTA